jgi:hypothetical protein
VTLSATGACAASVAAKSDAKSAAAIAALRGFMTAPLFKSPGLPGRPLPSIIPASHRQAAAATRAARDAVAIALLANCTNVQ